MSSLGSTAYLGGYEATEPKSLDELPVEIRKKLVAHLVARLGPEFYARLRFAGGQIVDLDAFHKAVPYWKEYQWEVFKYRLQFAFATPGQGIAEYVAGISLNSKGDVIEEIGLPAIAKVPIRRRSLRFRWSDGAPRGRRIRHRDGVRRHDDRIRPRTRLTGLGLRPGSR